MKLHLNLEDGAPIYRQIVDQIKFRVAGGTLRPGDELPPVRVLAERLLINPNTVARAYRELEQAGLVTARRGAGTYVANRGSPLALRERRRLLAARADALAAEARHLGFGLDETLRTVAARFRKLDAEQGERTDAGKRQAGK